MTDVGLCIPTKKKKKTKKKHSRAFEYRFESLLGASEK